MRVDEARYDRGPAQVNDSSTCRDLHLTLRSNICDSFAHEQHNLIRQHLAVPAVEQTPRADCDEFGCRRTFKRSNIRRSHARLRPHTAPWTLFTRTLRGLSAKCQCHRQHAEHCNEQRSPSHTKPPVRILTSIVAETGVLINLFPLSSLGFGYPGLTPWVEKSGIEQPRSGDRE